MTYEAQKENFVRECTAGEWTRAVLVGKRVMINNEGRYGYLYKGELYVSKKETEQPPPICRYVPALCRVSGKIEVCNHPLCRRTY